MPLHLSLPQQIPVPAEEPAVAPESLLLWLERESIEDPLRAGRAIACQLAALNTQGIRITLRQDLSEAFFAKVQMLLPDLDRRFAGGTLPLSPEARRASRVCEDLLGQLSGSYKLLLLEQSRRLFGFASSGRALVPVQRAIQLLAQRLVLSYRIYSSAPKGLWLELHELYQFAARRGLSQREVGAGEPTPLALYRRALLLALADPLRLMPGELDQVRRIVDELADSATIGIMQDQRPGPGLFVVKPQRDLPGHAASKRNQPAPQHHDLLLNALPVAEALLDRLARSATASRSSGSDREAGTIPAPSADLLAKLVKLWGAVPGRRFNRLRTQARVEICVGIEEIRAALDSSRPTRSVSGDWMVTNESPRGFALMHMSGPTQTIRVGEVVGLRSQEGTACHVCVVRWVLSDNPDHLELGLEELAPTARSAEVRGLRAGATAPFPALLLPEQPHQNLAASLLAPPATLDSTCELSVGELQAKMKVRPTQVIERTASMQVVNFSSLG